MTKIIQVKMNAENKCEICEKVYITKQKLTITLEKFNVAIFVHYSSKLKEL